jgi:hypothetical protein
LISIPESVSRRSSVVAMTESYVSPALESWRESDLTRLNVR